MGLPLVPARSLLVAGAAVSLFVLAGCTASAPAHAPASLEFNVFTATLDFNETAVGQPHDVFVPDVLIVQQGDHVAIRFHNVDEENHTFTIGAPYSKSVDIEGGANDTIAFEATKAGVFWYECLFHGPTMRGQFVVLKP